MKRENYSPKPSEAAIYKALLDNSDDLICLHQSNGDFIYLSPVIKNLLGFDSEELIGSPIFDLLHPMDKPILIQHFEKISEIKRFKINCRIRKKDDKDIWIEMIGKQIKTKLSESIWVMTSSRSIPAEKSVKNEINPILSLIEEKNRLLNGLLANCPIGIQIFDKQGYSYQMNEAQRNLLGIPSTSYGIGEFNALTDDLHKISGLDKLYQKVYAGESIVLSKVKIDLSNKLNNWGSKKEVIYIDNILFPITNENKEVEAAVSLIVDISEKVKTEKDIEAYHLLLSGISEAIPDDLFVFDLFSFEFLYTNNPASKNLGYTFKDIHKDLLAKIIHPEDLNKALALRKEIILCKKTIYEITLRVLHQDENYRWIYQRVIPFKKDEKDLVQQVIVILQDISIQKKADEKLKLSETRYKRLIENFENEYIFYACDEKGLCQYVSPSIQHILGYKEDELIQQHYASILTDNPQNREVKKLIQYNLKGGFSAAYEVEIFSKIGERRIFEISNVPLLNGEKKVIGLDGIAHDITERKEMEIALRKAKKEAEDASKAKEMFLSAMSHEIRTPMNAIVGLTNLLLQKNPRTEQMSELNLLKFSAENLLNLLNDILDYNKIGEGKVALEEIDFNLKGLLQNLEAIHKLRAEAKGIEILFKSNRKLPAIVKGDPTRINQILNNLLSNAIKFTEKGKVTLYTTFQKEENESVWIDFKIADTGTGIPQDKIQDIFERFAQSSPEITRKYGGTGLGLAITKNLLELYDSLIQVESKLNEGSKFYFSLRLKKANLKKIKEDKKSQNNLKKLKNTQLNILVVEDNEVNQLVVAEYFKLWKFNCSFASNGKKALQKIKEKIFDKFDIILMDLQMPEMDGYETSQKIREFNNEYYQKIPIIAVSAETGKNMSDKIKAAGMNDFILKPFNPDTLLDKIIKYAKKTTSQKSTSNGSGSIYDSILRFSDENAHFRNEFLKLNIELFTEFKQDFRKALLDKNLEKLKTLSHKLKPSLEILKLYTLEKKILAGIRSVQNQKVTSKSLHKLAGELADLCDEAVEKLRLSR